MTIAYDEFICKFKIFSSEMDPSILCLDSFVGICLDFYEWWGIYLKFDWQRYICNSCLTWRLAQKNHRFLKSKMLAYIFHKLKSVQCKSIFLNFHKLVTCSYERGRIGNRYLTMFISYNFRSDSRQVGGYNKARLAFKRFRNYTNF